MFKIPGLMPAQAKRSLAQGVEVIVWILFKFTCYIQYIFMYIYILINNPSKNPSVVFHDFPDVFSGASVSSS